MRGEPHRQGGSKRLAPISISSWRCTPRRQRLQQRLPHQRTAKKSRELRSVSGSSIGVNWPLSNVTMWRARWFSLGELSMQKRDRMYCVRWLSTWLTHAETSWQLRGEPMLGRGGRQVLGALRVGVARGAIVASLRGSPQSNGSNGTRLDSP